MKMNPLKAHIIRLEEELKQAKKENKSLTQKLMKAKNKNSYLQKELKKKDVLKVEFNKEEQQSLSKLLKDTDILNSLLD